MSVSEELRRAAIQVRAMPGCVFGEELANWLDHTADNMSDENAYEKSVAAVDGGTWIEVATDSDTHLGLTYEWTAALLTARKINTMGTVEPEMPEPVITEVAAEILEGLDARLDDRRDPLLGLDWAMREPEVAATDGPNAEGEYLVELLDGTTITWLAAWKRWAVTASDECEVSA